MSTLANGSGLRTFGLLLAGVWTLTMGVALLCLLPGYVEPRLQLYPHALPTPQAALGTFVHNVRAAGWPLLFAALGLHSNRPLRRLGNALLAVFLTANTALVGTALAVGGEQILPYLPHLPLEWAALAASATAWTLAAHATLRRRTLLVLTVGFLALLAAGAFVETYATPHL